jgi:hypothetical protein
MKFGHLSDARIGYKAGITGYAPPHVIAYSHTPQNLTELSPALIK